MLLIAAVLTLLLVSDGNHAGISFSRAENPEKLIKGAKEVCDTIYNIAGEREKRVLVPKKPLLLEPRVRPVHPHAVPAQGRVHV